MNTVMPAFIALACLLAATPGGFAAEPASETLVTDFTFISGRAAADSGKAAGELMPTVGEIFVLGAIGEGAGSNLNALRDEVKAALRLAEFDASPTVTRTMSVGKSERLVQTSGGFALSATLVQFDADSATFSIRIEQPGKRPSEAKIVAQRGSRATVGGRDGEPTPYFVLVVEPRSVARSTTRVGDPGVTEPKLVQRVVPVYPESAREARIQGAVVLEATIDTDGRVKTVKSRNEQAPELVEAAVAAVRQWRYEPARRNGTPVVVSMTVTISFRLS